MPERHIEKALAEALSAIERVESVYLAARGETLSVFTVIDDDDEETCDRIYNQERHLLRRFGDVRFDFNVIARRGRLLSEIMGAGNPIWQRSESGNECLTGTNT